MGSHFLHGEASVSVDWGHKGLFWEQINLFHYQTAYFRTGLSIVERRALCYSNIFIVSFAPGPFISRNLSTWALCSHSSLEGKGFFWVGLWKSHINEVPVVEKGFYDLHSCDAPVLSSHLTWGGYVVVVSAAERGPSASLGPLLQVHCQSADLSANQTKRSLFYPQNGLERVAVGDVNMSG